MNLPLNPLTLSFQYLILLFTGTNLDTLLSNFINGDRIGRFFQYFPNRNTGGNTFDFIIVGGGSAGCVIANRLSASNNRVLLLEVGGNPFPLTSVPSMAMLMLNHPETDWSFKTTPQTDSFKAMVNNAAIHNRGKGLGGSSLLNYMVYMRGNPNDFDNWAKMTGDPSWSYENVLPIFKRMEDYDGHFPNHTTHGKAGPLHVEAQGSVPLMYEWLEAGKELGYKINDPNGYQNASFFPPDTTTKKGTRFSTHRAYLHPVLGRPNLDVYTYSHVHKVHLDENNKAVGVTYTRNGQQHYVKVRKEIIISAGAICSPQILMLSGIGPREHLESLGIPVKLDLPVGQNFQDHFLSPIGPFLVNEGKTFMGDRDFNSENLQKYLQTGEGPYGTFPGAAALFESSKATPGWPDIYMTYIPNGLTKTYPDELQGGCGFKPDILQKYLANDIGRDGFFATIVLSLPKSRGEIKLNSTNPFDYPLIDPKYLSHQEDISVVLEGVQKVLKLIKTTKAFNRIGGKLTESLFPGCENFADTTSDEYWDCYVRHFSGTMFHYSGTCRMGASSGDPGAVLDSQLRVIGAKGLRVIDASSIPQITTTNTNAPVIMIAEKGSDAILSSWRDR